MRVGRQAALSDPGRRRRRNEDAYVVQPPLFAIADGMGGAQAGEVASRLAAAALEEGSSGSGDGRERVEALVQEANRRVYKRSSEDPDASGMGTTITAALVDAGVVWIGHVGDSRAYLLRDGALQQLTEDHSLVAELVRSGRLSAEEAQTHPQRSVITRAVGTDADVDVDTFPIEPRPGDVFLLCSDGLTDMIDDGTIAGIVQEHRDDLEAAARTLVAAANRGGGEDNITVVVFDVAEGGAEADEDATARLPAVDADDEDTLSELDAVPAIDTMVVAPEEAVRMFDDTQAESAPAPAAERGDGRGPRVLATLALVLALLLIAALVVWGVLR